MNTPILRVLHVYKTYYPDTIGGVEKFIDQLISSLAPHGIQSTVLVLTADKKASIISINNYTVYKIPYSFSLASCPVSWKIIKYFSTLVQQCDIIHYHFPWPFMDFLHLFFSHHKPSVVTYHADIIKQKCWLKIYRPLMLRFLNSVDRIIATSPQYLATSVILQKFSYKTSVIPIGLDMQNGVPTTEDSIYFWKKRFDKPFFLFIGTARYYKGLKFLVQAAIQSNASVVIVGQGCEIYDQITSGVYFLGNLNDDDKRALLTTCYAVVMPSHLRSEAFGIALLEGAMFGKPLISCEIETGTSYINIANETGLVVPPADAESLAHAMQFLLDNPAVAFKMGQSARQRYEQLFQADVMAQSYADVYTSIL